MKNLVFLMSLFISMTLYAQETIAESNKTQNVDSIEQIKKQLVLIKLENNQLKSRIEEQENLHKDCKNHNQNAHDDVVASTTNKKAGRFLIEGSKNRNVLPPPL